MNRKLLCIKLLHTVIWAFYVFVIFYILYSGIFNKINAFTFVSIGLVVLEGIILLIFKWRCPLTVIGFKYSDTKEVGFDIFLPKWLAKHNKAIFTAIFVLGSILVAIRLI